MWQSSLSQGRGRRALAGLVLAFTVPSSLAQTKSPQEPRNLVANGGFENPSIPVGGTQRLIAAAGWTAEVGTMEIQNQLGGRAAFEGQQVLALDSLAVVSQACRTKVGQQYSLGFAYSPRREATQQVSGALGGVPSFEVWYAGVKKETIVVPAGGATAWVSKHYAVAGVTTADEVEFRALSSGAVAVLIDDCFLIPYDPAASGELLRNGNFEEDPRLAPGTSLKTAAYIGWTSPRGKKIPVDELGSADGYDGRGVFHLNDKNIVLQRVHVVPGQSYQLRFAYSPDPADDRARSFTVKFGGRILDTISVPLSTTIGWTARAYTVTSPTPLTAVEFTDLGNGEHGALIDAVSLVGPVPVPETAGQVSAFYTVSRSSGGGILLDPEDMFARGITSLGDVDGDGVQDLAVGAVGDDDGGDNAGAVWILFLNANRTVKASQKISELRGGLVADLKKDDGFGRALSGLGDLDGDGVPDLAVGANEDDTGGSNAGAVYVLFLTRQGTVRAQHMITGKSGDRLDYRPVVESNFGAALAGMGDVDGDGIPDMAVGSRFGDSVQTCFMRRDGTVRDSKNITYGVSGFTDTVTSVSDFFGMSCANMGDFDRDGVNDLLVGAFGRRIYDQNYVGGQYLLLLRPDGTVKRWFYYGTENMNTRTQTLAVNYNLGTACAGLGDVDGDGVLDLATGAQREGPMRGLEREENSNEGAVYVLLLNADGTIKTCQRIGDRAGGLELDIADGTRFGEALCGLGDLDGDGLADVAVASRFVNGTGAVYLCELLSSREPLRADFAAAPVTGTAPLAVLFTDLSTGPVASWLWEFGDSASSSLRNPGHTYGAAGVYSVRLTVTGTDGSSQAKTVAGLVTVSGGTGGLPEGVVKLGCGVNPPTSFQLVSGEPRIGTTMVFAVDNPYGTQAPGSIPELIASWTPSTMYPCGTLLDNKGMSAPRTPGELLMTLPLWLTRSGAAWTGAGRPAPVSLAIPNNASFLGLTMVVQGRLLDGSPGALIPIGLADGFALTFRR